MQLTEHTYANKPKRCFIDGRRVTPDRFELVKIEARIAGWQHCCFSGRILDRTPGAEHSVFYSCINKGSRRHA